MDSVEISKRFQQHVLADFDYRKAAAATRRLETGELGRAVEFAANLPWFPPLFTPEELDEVRSRLISHDFPFENGWREPPLIRRIGRLPSSTRKIRATRTHRAVRLREVEAKRARSGQRPVHEFTVRWPQALDGGHLLALVHPVRETRPGRARSDSRTLRRDSYYKTQERKARMVLPGAGSVARIPRRVR